MSKKHRNIKALFIGYVEFRFAKLLRRIKVRILPCARLLSVGGEVISNKLKRTKTAFVPGIKVKENKPEI